MYLIPYWLSQAPDAELEQLFDPTQLKAMKKVLEQGKQMEGMLRRQGLLDDE